jgi:hypothetical protein
MIKTPDILLFIHPAFGIISILAAVWLLVEALNANENNKKRIHCAAYNVVGWMILAWIFGGQWYVEYYPSEKAMILKGSWPFAHTFFMEVKEHLFFIPLILSLYLPIVSTRNNLHSNAVARKMVIAICALIIIIALAIKGAGAVISEGSKISFSEMSAAEGQK